MFSFAWPWSFVLLPLPLLVYFFVKPYQRRLTPVYVPFFNELTNQQNKHAVKTQQSLWRVLTLTLIWLLLVTASARPQWLGEPVALPLSGRDLLLAVDISESMNQQDMTIQDTPVTRLAIVKNVLAEFIEQRQGDRLGLVLFGTNAYLQTPLTFDAEAVSVFLNEAQLGFAGSKTAIGEAIGLSVKRLQALQQSAENSNDRVIILLTDGANTAGEISPIQAAQLAEQLGIKIYTIGIGAEEMIVGSLFGSRRINPSAQLDEVTLRAISQTTGGEYFRARNIDELNSIYETIDALEPIEQDEAIYRPTRSLFYWFSGSALLIVFLLGIWQWYQHKRDLS